MKRPESKPVNSLTKQPDAMGSSGGGSTQRSPWAKFSPAPHLNGVFDRFPLASLDIDAVIAGALSGGGEFAELFFEKTDLPDQVFYPRVQDIDVGRFEAGAR